MTMSGLVCNEHVSWVTIHSGYDFGLVKMLTGRVLSGELTRFFELLNVFLGLGFMM
ncbi:putative poly(A)-specific ribonuclease [Helianthus debilis subsp. tardiflorus]